MKRSELRKLIREEASKLNESRYVNYSGMYSDATDCLMEAQDKFGAITEQLLRLRDENRGDRDVQRLLKSHQSIMTDLARLVGKATDEYGRVSDVLG